MSKPVRRAIYGKLAGDGTLNALLGTPAPGYAKNIYHATAPSAAPPPYVIISKQAGTPTEAFGDPSAVDTDIWLVKGVDRNSTADAAEDIAARCVTLLNDAALSVSGLSLLYLRRQSDVEYSETIDGELYRHVGSLYRLVTTD